jgi:hypothetical protein
VDGCNNVQNLNGFHRISRKKRYDKICKKHKTFSAKYKKNFCEHPQCSWKGSFDKILEVDHIDGNKANILESNFITLCSNCHKIKTYNEKNESQKISHEKVDLIREQHQNHQSQTKKTILAICMTKGCTNLQTKHDNRNGVWRYKKYCRSCMRLRRIGYIKKDHCENKECCHNGTFQYFMLEVDHIDENRTNNSKINLQTLCANCHSIKSKSKKQQ